jgi:adenylate kinase
VNSLIFVGGIHGVGKTYFCSILTKEMNLSHYSSSQLISKQKQELYSSNKNIKFVNENQDFLIYALEQLNLKDQHFLLDGHFCLLNYEGEIVKIPEETFLKINPKTVVVLIDSISSIAQRLFKRDNKKYDHTLLEKFQNEELEYAKYITNMLNVSLHVYNTGNIGNDLKKLVASILK